MADGSTALWSVYPNCFFPPARLLSGCVCSLQKPFCVLPCVYMPFPLSLLLLISLKSLSDALNICGAQKHLHARSASVFWQASTSFKLHFHCFFCSSTNCILLNQQLTSSSDYASPVGQVMNGHLPICGSLDSRQNAISVSIPLFRAAAGLSFRFFPLSTKTHSWGSTKAAGDACKWAVGH